MDVCLAENSGYICLIGDECLATRSATETALPKIVRLYSTRAVPGVRPWLPPSEVFLYGFSVSHPRQKLHPC